MNSFTEDIKEEITKRFPKSASMHALLAGFAQVTDGVSLGKEGAFLKIVTENGNTAQFLASAMSSLNIHPESTGIKSDVITGKDKMYFEYSGDATEDLLSRCGLIEDGEVNPDIPAKAVSRKADKISYIKGAFLGGGSCTIPDESTYSRTGYHFEINCPSLDLADEICDLLISLDIIAKTLSRKGNSIVYIKSKEVISDLFNMLGIRKSQEKLDRIAEFKDERNNINRANNCAVSNIDKTVTASVKQVQAIETIRNEQGLESLDRGLYDVAIGREQNLNASMSELADILGISKSCLMHRFNRIQAIADNLRKQQ
ncbi:MAG: DNA-binding protein WhiA [Clostridia bacterium]|nr:DNA-binding protein WhiA [Clostridia bacterium]